MKKPTKPYWEMNTAELREATKEYDRPGRPKFLRPPPEERRRHEEALRKVGRPRVGQGAKRVLITIERGLLKDADALARRRNTSRARLIAEGLKMVLKKAG